MIKEKSLNKKKLRHYNEAFEKNFVIAVGFNPNNPTIARIILPGQDTMVLLRKD